MVVLPDPPHARSRTLGRLLTALLALVVLAGGAIVATEAHESPWVRRHAPWLVEPAARLDQLSRDAGALLSSVAPSVTPSVTPWDGGEPVGPRPLDPPDADFAAPDSLPETP